MLKLDSEKAFGVLRQYSFVKRLQDLMDKLDQRVSVEYKHLCNGRPIGKFTASRGLRQGDSIPFLFTLAGHALSRSMQ